MAPNNTFVPVEKRPVMNSSAPENDDSGTAETELSFNLDNKSATPQTHQTRPSNNAKRISWASVQLREYPIIPGDNPAAIGGVPLTIHWEHVEEVLVSVDEFEASRPSSPRLMIEMRMPPTHRNDLLRRLGFSRGDVTAALRSANIARAQRRRTAETMNLAAVQESLEKVKRATLNVTLRRSKKVQEKKLLETYCGTARNGTAKDCKENKAVEYSDNSLSATLATNAESLEYSSPTVEQQNEVMPMRCRRHRDSILIR